MNKLNTLKVGLAAVAGLVLAAMPGEKPQRETPAQHPQAIASMTSGSAQVVAKVAGFHQEAATVLAPDEEPFCGPQDLPILAGSPSGEPISQCLPPDELPQVAASGQPAARDVATMTDPGPEKRTKSPKKPLSLETGKGGEDLARILEVYAYVLGPGRTKGEFYYIDISDRFTPYGPFPDDPNEPNRGGFHDENRRKIAARNPKVHVDTYRDLPVPAAAGVPSQRFERKLQRAKADYKGRPLIAQFGDYFDRHFETSRLQNLLQEAGQDQYFRDLVIYGLIGVESGYNPQMSTYAGRDARGRAIYAKGLAQAVDHTQRHMENKRKLRRGLDPFVPEHAAEYCVALFDNNLKYLMEAVGADSFLFRGENAKSLLIPLLFTSYNQGHGRLVRMAQYFTALHESGTIPEQYYLDQEPTFTPDTAVWFFSRAFTLTKSGKTPKGFTTSDENFRRFNSGFGSDGAQYAFKAQALAQAMEAAIDR